MRLRYDPGSDILLLTLRDAPPREAEEHDGGIVITYGSDGEPICIEVLHASTRGLVGQGVLDLVLGSESGASQAG